VWWRSGALARRRGVLIVLTILVLVAWVTGACGSVPRGSFGVEVTDPSGEPVEGVEVRMSGSGGDYSGATDQYGSVVFESVQPGSYDVSASRAGFEPVRMSGVRTRPGGFLDLRMQPLAEVEPSPTGAREEPFEIVEVFYGTDRNRRSARQIDDDPRRIYGGDRGELRLGTLEVSIPKDHRMGELEAPRWWRLEFRPDPKRHVVLLSIDELPEDDFARRLRERVDETEHREAFVFVHGYNVDFDEAARRTAQIAYDIHHDLVPILFSWPSRGTVAGYPADETNVAWAEPDLREFLTLIAERSGAAEVHVIAHSMGSRALTGVLEDFVQAGRAGEEAPRFDEIVLVAPDIDAGRFRRDIAPALVPAGERVTLYGSSRDRALEMSRRFHSYPRIGDLSAGVVVMPGIDLIDATAVDTSLTGHSYFADGDSVLADLFHLFREGLAPPRPSLEPVGEDPERYWRFVPP
jgi:esterase/lipase superfamily enzyme